MLSKNINGQLCGAYEYRAEFFDVDSMNVVWHGNHVKYLEMARCAFLRDLDFSYMDMKKYGFVMPIVKLECKYITPLEFNEKFLIEVVLVEWDSFLRFNYTLKNMQGNILSKASTSQVAVMIDSKETCFNLPQVLQDVITTYNIKLHPQKIEK